MSEKRVCNRCVMDTSAMQIAFDARGVCNFCRDYEARLQAAARDDGDRTARREQFLDQASAMAALEAARDQQLKRGFQLMFVQGADAPK